MFSKVKHHQPSVLDTSGDLPVEVSNLDLRRLQAFVLAAKTQCFGTAAQRLNVVPSAISHGIRGLETELGCELFKRKGPKVSLTRAGLRLIPFANEILNRIHDLHDAAKCLQSQEKTLRISLPEILCSKLLPAVLHGFEECMPGVLLNVTPTGTTAECCASLSSGKIDVYCSPTEDMPDNVQSKVIFQERLGFYSSSEHPLASASNISWSTLKEYPVYVPDVESSELLTRQFSRQVHALPPAITVLPSIESIHNITQASHGISMLPMWAVKSHSPPTSYKSLLVRLDAPTHKRSWSAYWHSGNHLSWTLEVLLGLMEIHISEIHDQMMN